MSPLLLTKLKKYNLRRNKNTPFTGVFFDLLFRDYSDSDSDSDSDSEVLFTIQWWAQAIAKDKASSQSFSGCILLRVT